MATHEPIVVLRLWCFDRAAASRGSAEFSTPTLAQSSTPSLGSHDDAKVKVKGAEGKDGQRTKGYGPLATQLFRSARVEGEPYREVPATPKAETHTSEDSTSL